MSSSAEKENVFLKIVKYLIPWKGDKPTEMIRKIIFLAAAVTLVVTLVLLISSFAGRNEDNANNQMLSEIYHGTAASKVEITDPARRDEIIKEHPSVQEEFLPLLDINEDIIGWITIGDDAFIDYPVMQTKDNDYYLDHSFYKQSSKSGALFADYRNKITADEQSANVIIYGHNMASGEYFGQLPYYFNYAMSHPDHEDISFYKEHPTIKFSTLYKTSTYKIFGGMLVNVKKDGGEVFKYHNIHNFASKTDFDNFCAEVLDRSTFINPDVDLKYGDNLITLSTCMLGKSYGDTDLRWVIFARETRDGESPEVDVSRAYSNPSPKFYELYYTTLGGKWEGRGWKEDIIRGYNR